MPELALDLAPTEDDRLEQAEALVHSYCGWHIAPSRVDAEVTFQETCGRILILPSLHVTAVSSVTEDGAELTVDDDYTWQANGVITRRYARWTTGPIVVTFTHGYENVPPDVTAVVQSIAQRAVDNPRSLVRSQIGPFAETYSQTGFNQSLPLALLAAEQSILDHYKLPSRP